MYYFYKSLWFMFAIIRLIPVKLAQNLFCNETFQAYNTSSYFSSTYGYNIYYRMFSADACWYTVSDSTTICTMEIQKASYANYTKVCELDGNNCKYKLCQNKTLQLNQIYNFTFNFAFNPNMSSSTAITYLNFVPVKTQTQNITNPLVGKVSTHIFITQQLNYEICVGSTQTWTGGVVPPGQATFVDNFTLFKLPKTPVITNFEAYLADNSLVILLNSSSAFNSSHLTYIQDNSVVSVNGVLQSPSQVAFYIDSSGHLAATVNLSAWVNITNITCQTPGFLTVGSTYYVFSFSFQYKKTANVLFQAYLPNNSSILFLNSSSSLNSTFVSFIQNYHSLSINGFIQNPSTISFFLSASNLLSSNISLSSWQNISTISCSVSDLLTISANVYNFQFSFQYKQQIQLMFVSQFDNRTKIISMKTSQPYSSIVFDYVVNNSLFSVSGVTLTNVSFTNTITGIEASGILSSNYSQPFTGLVSGNLIQSNKFYNFTVSIRDLTQQNKIYPQSQFMLSVQKNSILFFQSFFSFYTMLRATGCSYFLINFLTFYNLIVLYNFININAQPLLSYNTLLVFARLYLENDNQLYVMIGQVLQKVGITTSFNFQQFVQNKGGKQKMLTNIGRFVWFNDMGITYNFAQNNFVDFFLYGLLVVKLLLIFLMRQTILMFMSKFIISQKRFVQILFLQILCSCPIMIISSLSTLQLLSSQYFLQKINIILHACILLFILNLPFLYYLTVYFPFLKKWKKYQNNVKKANKIKYYRQVYWVNIFSCFKYGIHILIPIMIVLQDKIAFFISITAYIIFQYFIYVKSYPHINRFRKLTFAIFIFNLLAHHLCFMAMFIVENKDQNQAQQLQRICHVCGIIVIFTVLFGGITQILLCIYELFDELIVPTIKKLKSTFCKQKPNVQFQSKDNRKNQNSKDKLCFSTKTANFKIHIKKLSDLQSTSREIKQFKSAHLKERDLIPVIRIKDSMKVINKKQRKYVKKSPNSD